MTRVKAVALVLFVLCGALCLLAAGLFVSWFALFYCLALFGTVRHCDRVSWFALLHVSLYHVSFVICLRFLLVSLVGCAL